MAAPKRVKAVEPDSVREPIGEAVVDSLPYGLVVVQVDHTISATNAAARRFLPQLEDARHCHEAFSCRTPGGPCEHGCLAARAVESFLQRGETAIRLASTVLF